MIALLPLPGAPLYDGDDQRIIDHALFDLEAYKKVGVDSVFLENDNDRPYVRPPMTREAVELVTTIGKELRSRFEGPIGIQMLEQAYEESLKIALDADLDYLRIEAYVFAHVGSAGIIEGCAGKLLRLRKQLNGEHLKIFADVQKKHAAHALTADLDITDEIRQGELCLADGFVITSQFTGMEPKADDLVKASGATQLPLIIGSGMTPENISKFYGLADGFIVGSAFRKNGNFLDELDQQRLQSFMKAFRKLRGSDS